VSALQERIRPARLRTRIARHRFLILALLAGPLGSSALYFAPHVGLPEMPQPSLGWAALANALVLAPVLEELVFRGGIQGVLDRTRFGACGASMGVSVGNLLTSVFFSAAHLITAPAWLAAGVFLPSLVFGRLKQLYQSLVPAILVHAWYNACYLAASVV
jgi:membrane protease YdiL (CAAX protease family)